MKLVCKILYVFFLLPVIMSCVSPTTTPSSPSTSTNASYYFSPHTGDEAQNILTQSEEFILSKPDEGLEMPLSQYSDNYSIAFYAAWNAILYFPNDPRTKIWASKMAYYAALSGNSDTAIKIYIEKITKALNEDGITIEELPNWFQSGELRTEYITPEFELQTQPIKTTSREDYLVHIGVSGGVDVPGNVCLLINKDKDIYQTYLIYDGFPKYGFFPSLRHPSYCYLEDATGDGIEEVISQHWEGGHVGALITQVTEISSISSKILPFNSSSDEKISTWNGNIEDFISQNGKIQIPISEPLGQCNIYLTKYYEWNGSWFVLRDVSLKGDTNTLKSCYYYVMPYDNDYNPLSSSEKIQIIDEALEFYSAVPDDEKDILEEFRIQKGVIYLFEGDTEKSIEVFNEIANNPLKQDSIWIQPVKDFLKTYQGTDDIYRACSALIACDPNRPVTNESAKQQACLTLSPCQSQALEFVISKLSLSSNLKTFTSDLKKAGVEIDSEGWLDFDQDNKEELWFFTENAHYSGYSLWVVTDYPNGIQTISLGVYPNSAFEFTLENQGQYQTVIKTRHFRNIFWYRDVKTLEVSTYSLYEQQTPKDVLNRTSISLDINKFRNLQRQLINQENNKNVYQELLVILKQYNNSCPYEIPVPYSNFYKYECGNFYFTIGFAAEITKNNEIAIDMYTKIVELYPDSPFSLLAEIKLNK